MQQPAPPPNRFARCERLALALGVGCVVVAVWSAVCETPRLDWNAARLMPAFLLAAGEKIYFPPETGPALGWIYGPVMPVVMTPSTWLPSLTSAMMVAACINAALLLGPLLGGVNGVAKRAGMSRRDRAGLALACAGGALAVPWIGSSLVFLTADNIVVGLALGSCICLARSGDGARFAWGAAVLAALAVWTKQLAIGVPVAQLLWLAWSAGGGAALRQSARLLVAGLVLSAGFVAIFGWVELRYNLWTIPSHHPLKGGVGFWLSQIGALSVACLPWAVALGVLRARSPAPGRAASLVAVVAVVQIPLGALGATKVGGGENSFHAVYYLSAAAWLECAASTSVAARWFRQHLVVCAAVAVLAGLLGVRRFTDWRMTPAVQLEASCVLANAHPGEIYFPRNPLVTWWTDKKVYHLEYGFLDQALAGHPATPARFAAWLPARLRYLAYQDDDLDHPFARMMPGFERIVSGPGFVIHVAEAPSTGGR